MSTRPKRQTTFKRHQKARQRFNELFEKKRMRYDDAIETVAEET